MNHNQTLDNLYKLEFQPVGDSIQFLFVKQNEVNFLNVAFVQLPTALNMG